MNISGCDERPAILFFDLHDAVERVLASLAFFYVMYEMHDFLAMRAIKFPVQCNKSGGIIILYALTCGTDLLMRTAWGFKPLPAPLLEHRAALWTYGRLRHLQSCPVGIMHALLEELVMPGNLTEAGGSGMRAHGKILLCKSHLLFAKDDDRVCHQGLRVCAFRPTREKINSVSDYADILSMECSA